MDSLMHSVYAFLVAPRARDTGRASVVFDHSAGMFKRLPGTRFLWHEVSLTVPANSDSRATGWRWRGASRHRHPEPRRRRRISECEVVAFCDPSLRSEAVKKFSRPALRTGRGAQRAPATKGARCAPLPVPRERRIFSHPLRMTVDLKMARWGGQATEDSSI